MEVNRLTNDSMRVFWLLSDLVTDHVNVMLDKPNYMYNCDSNILQVNFDLEV